jgi:glycosyltransferase involved in cell wall biosynthesis
MPDQPPTVLLVLAKSTGGIGRHVRDLAAGLPSRGIRVVVCAPPDMIDSFGLDELGVDTAHAPLGGASPQALAATRRALRAAATNVDIAHAHGLRAGADCVAVMGSTPLIVTWHNARPVGGWRQVGHAALGRYVARSSDLILAASADLAAEARAAGGQVVQETFVTAPTPAAATQDPAQLRADLGIADRPMVLAVGRLQRQKRLDVLVAAAAAWADQDDSPVVVIAGEGPEHDRLAAQLAASRAPVLLLGARDDVANLMAAADVVALPSEWEARALVAQEALRAGVPLVTTAVGGLPDLVGEAARFVPVGDAAALHAAIVAVLSDDDYRTRLIRLGGEQARSWPSQDACLDELALTYLDLIRRVRLQKG